MLQCYTVHCTTKTLISWASHTINFLNVNRLRSINFQILRTMIKIICSLDYQYIPVAGIYTILSNLYCLNNVIIYPFYCQYNTQWNIKTWYLYHKYTFLSLLIFSIIILPLPHIHTFASRHILHYTSLTNCRRAVALWFK